ncbi:MAG TPA: DUF2961 domain-containing protein [Cyclobacteriaceae bacterium]|nr:DUF2961 domain-containing protein [Cyclobacteriaceae bacterium]
MNRFYLALIGILLIACKEQPPTHKISKPREHSLSTELQAFYNLGTLPQFMDSTTVAQVSSYDTTGNNDDGFSGRYSFLRRNADSTLVIFDVQGSGVIDRIWTPTPTEDIFDFYIDDESTPRFSIKFIDLFSGKQFPFVSPLCGNQLGGFFSYMPIPFQKSCRIVTHGKKIQFHQIQYRMYEAGAKVKSFNLALNEDEKAALTKIDELWNKELKSLQDFYSTPLTESKVLVSLVPGETKSVFEVSKGGRILGIELDPVEAFEGLTKNIDLKITWDDEIKPAVYCPVADFFGYAFGTTSMQSLLLGSQDNKNYSYLPMPFDSKAKIELVYRNGSEPAVAINARIWYSDKKRVPDQEGKFYAQWNRVSEKGKPHVLANISGRGHYVGTILQAQGKQAGMTYFFEGDDSTVVDGHMRMHGTGSEDYFNGGWYALMDRWEGKMSLPLHGALDYSLPFCRTGGFRLFITDKISFNKSLLHTIEHGPVGNQFPVDYTSLGLYYSDTPVNEVQQPTAQLTNVFLPDTLYLYPQLMDLNVSADLDIKTTWKYGTGGLSYTLTPGNDSWLRVSLKEIPAGTYDLYLDVMKEPFGCEVSLWQRQTLVSDWISTYAGKEERVKEVFACTLDIREFKNTLTFRFKTDIQKTGIIMNRMKLIRKR